MKKTKVKLTETVYVSIDFKNIESQKEFYQWTLEYNVYPNVQGGYSGPSVYRGFYTKQDARKIKKYLLLK